MKKALLLSLIAASSTVFAATSGSVEAYMKPVTDFTGLTAKSTDDTKKTSEFFNKVKGTKFESGLKTEVKVKDSGLSFGADLINGDASTFFPLSLALNTEKTNAWIKYEFPAVKDVKTYAKASMNFESRVNLEGDAKTTVNDVELGLNSKLGLSLTGSNVNAVKPVLVVKGFVKSNVSVVKDAKLEVEARADFKEKAKPAAAATAETTSSTTATPAKAKLESLTYLQAVLSGKYEEVKDLTLTGEARLRYNFSKKEFNKYGNSSEFEYDSNDLYKGLTSMSKFAQVYKVDAEYKAVKDTTLKGFVRFGHFNDDKLNLFAVNAKADATYKGVENTTLNANLELVDVVIPSGVENGKTKYTNVLATKLGASAEYEYKVTDKLTVSPKLDASARVLSELVKDSSSKVSVSVTPSVKAEYKVSDSLTLTGKTSLPVVYASVANEQAKQELKYDSTKLKSEFNIKYTW